ncbi:MAG: hypothetical protein ACT4PP_07845 [Sporichthyaceae bacterium]
MSTSTAPGRLCRPRPWADGTPESSTVDVLGLLTARMLRRGMPLTLLSDLAWPGELPEIHQTHAA